MMSDCKRYASPSDICLVEHPKGVFCKYDDVKKLEAENKALREAVQTVVDNKYQVGITTKFLDDVDALAALLEKSE